MLQRRAVRLAPRPPAALSYESSANASTSVGDAGSPGQRGDRWRAPAWSPTIVTSVYVGCEASLCRERSAGV